MLVSELPPIFVRVLAFVFGALWGSFFNVAVYRWPRGLSVVHPPSTCPTCGTPIPGWRNVPIFAYALQRGRAACCGAKMTPRYVVVEAVSALIMVAIAERYFIGVEPGADAALAALECLLWFAFAGGLLIATFADLEWMEIPDEVSVGGTALGLATAAFRSGYTLEEIVLGAGGGYLLVQLVIVWSWARLTGREGMGGGDPKLVMFIGAFLGWRGVLFALVAGSFQGIVAWGVATATGARIGPSEGELPELEAFGQRLDPVTGKPIGKVERGGSATESETGGETESESESETESGGESETESETESESETETESGGEPDARIIPFGPFLALGALEFLFFGNTIVEWYLALLS